MKTKRASLRFYSVIVLAFMLVLSAIMCFTSILGSAKADGSSFEMVEGVSLKINEDGGIRFRVKMDEQTKNNVKNNDNVKLYFIITSLDNFNAVENDTYYETLSVNNKGMIIEVDEEKIYLVGTSYYANGCITEIMEENRKVDRVAIAAIETDNAGVKSYAYASVNGKTVADADFSINNVRGNLNNVLSKAVLDSGDVDYSQAIFACTAYNDWFMTEDYPLEITSVEKYEDLVKKINKDQSFDGKYIKISGFDPADSTVEFDNGKGLPEDTTDIEQVQTEFTVNFYDEAGELIESKTFDKGDEVVAPTAPAKQSTAQFDYEFAGWISSLTAGVEVDLSSITKDTDVYASYDAITRKYTITFNYEGGQKTVDCEYGYLPAFDANGEVPATYAGTDGKIYDFNAWSPALTEVTEAAEYTATYTARVIMEASTGAETNAKLEANYTYIDEGENLPDGASYAVVANVKYYAAMYLSVKLNGEFKADKTYKMTLRVKNIKYDDWYDLKVDWNGGRNFVYVSGNGSIGTGSYGDHLTSTGEVKYVTIGEDAYSYMVNFQIFHDQLNDKDLSFAISIEFEEVETYTVTWENYDGSELEKDLNVLVGTTPTYDGATPTKEATGVTKYIFTGWDKEVSAVTEDVVYTAQFKEVGLYTVTWNNYDGSELEVDLNVEEGTLPVYNGATPVKPTANGIEYVFAGWSPVVSEVTGEITYTATFKNAAFDVTAWGNGTGSRDIEGTTFTYTENASELPDGASYAYVVDVPNYNNNSFTFKTIFNRQFNAEKVYNFHIKVKAFTIAKWLDFKVDWNGGTSVNNNNFSGKTNVSIEPGSKSTFEHTQKISIAEAKDALTFSFGLSNGGYSGALKFAISIEVEELTTQMTVNNGVSCTKIEDEELPANMVYKYKFVVPSGITSSGFTVTADIAQTFEAGKSYKFTINYEHIENNDNNEPYGNPQYYDFIITWSDGTTFQSTTNGVRYGLPGKNATVAITETAYYQSIAITFKWNDGKAGAFKLGIVVEEV